MSLFNTLHLLVKSVTRSELDLIGGINRLTLYFQSIGIKSGPGRGQTALFPHRHSERGGQWPAPSSHRRYAGTGSRKGLKGSDGKISNAEHKTKELRQA